MEAVPCDDISGSRRVRAEGAILLPLLVCAALHLWLMPVAAQAEPDILILNSYHHGFGWSDNIVDGILSGLPANAEFAVEYMDTKRFGDERSLALLYDLYAHKYADAALDVIISCDDNALRFLFNHHAALFPGVPVVFCGVNHLEALPIEERPLFTGVEEKLYQGKSLEAALKLHPETERLVIITDSTTSGRGNRRKLERIAKDILPDGIAVEFWDEAMGLTKDALLARAAALPPNTVVYYSDFFVDGSGAFVDYESFIPRLAAACPHPIYSQNDTYLGLGVLGGHMASGYHQGAKAVELARRILDGKKPRNIPIVHESPNRYMFDHEQLMRFGIDPKDLPPGSLVINEPFSMYERHKALIWIVLLALAAQSIVIAALIVISMQRKRAKKALQESEEKFRLLFENAPVGIVQTTPEGRYVAVNPEFARIIGYGSPEEVIESVTDIGNQLYADPGDRVRLCEVLDSKGEINQLEYRLKHREGHVVWVASTVRAVRDATGRSVMYEGFISDITKRRQAEVEIRRARDAAEAASRAKSEFLANMSHELRTPLNGIMGMLQLMQTTELDEEQEEYTITALNSSERLTRLLSDILDLSRVEARKLSIQNEPFNLHEAVRQVCELFRITSKQTGVSLHCEFDSALPESVTGDATRLQQVLNNLVGNAFKFTSSGSVTVAVYPLPSHEHGACRALFMVSDTGIGIPEYRLAELMEPFTQASEGFARKHQGAGLGLAICKRLVALMNGGMAVESELKQGTTVYFSVKFGLAEAVVQGGEDAASVPGGKLPCSVLLAEDDTVSSYSTKKLLEKAGCAVTAVGDGRQALDALRQRPFDVVLMDVQLPVMDGVEATKAIRQGWAGKDREEVPIVALTAYAMSGDKEKFLAAGMSDYLSKPVDFGPLLKTLGKITGRDLSGAQGA